VQTAPIMAISPLIILLVFLTLSPYSFSANLGNTISIKLATAENFAPYAYTNENKQWQGIDYDITSEIFKILDIQFKPTALPRARITKMLNHNSIDGLLSTAAYNEPVSLDKLWLSIPIYTSEVSVFSLKLNPHKVNNISILNDKKYRLGALKEYSYHEANISLNNSPNILKVHRDQQLVELLILGRIDLAISEDISFIYQARRLGKFDLIEPLLEISSKPVRIALTKDFIKQHPSLPQKINYTITQLLNNGFIDLLIIKYMSLDRFSLAE